MIIKRTTTEHYRIPLPVVLTDSTHGEMPFFELITIRIETDEGDGLGYVYTVGKGGAAVRSLLDLHLVPLLQGADAARIEHLWQRMWWELHYVGRGGVAAFAISAVDIALWDLRGRSVGMPLWKLLGGYDPRVRAYAGGIDLQLPLDGLREQTRENLARGFRAIKMKVGRPSLTEDVERVAAMREFVGPDIVLMADANMRWTVSEATAAARAFAPHNLLWLEEPTIPDDAEGHAQIAQAGGVPVAAGENLHTIYEFREIMQRGRVAFPEPDVANVGGVTAWMKVAHFAEAMNLRVTTHGVHDLHVHLLAAIPNASFLEAHGFGLERYIRHPMTFEDGVTVAPDRPGHGVEFDWEAMRSLRA